MIVEPGRITSTISALRAKICRVHGTIKMTPAQKSGLTTGTWSLQELLAESAKAT
jgi:hypothetical protein